MGSLACTRFRLTPGQLFCFIDAIATHIILFLLVCDVLFVIMNLVNDAILPRRGPIIRAMARRLQEDWAKDAGEGPRILMSLRVDFGPMV